MSDLESELQRRGLIKVAQENTKEESPYRRVAKFLYLVGEDQAAHVLQKLSREQIEKVTAEMLTIRYIDKDEAAYILSQFTALYNDAKNSIGGVETAETILTNAFGDEKAREILDRAVPVVPEKPFDFLDNIDADRLNTLLKDELASTKALVLSQLKPKIAAAYIKQLNDEEKKDVVLRLARLETVHPDILRTVSTSIREKFSRLQSGTAETIDGRAALAAILRRSNAEIGDVILHNLASESPELEQDIRDRLFTLDDVVLAEDLFLQKKLSEMEDEELAALISYKSTAFTQKILSNISKNRARYILEEQKHNPPSLKTCKEITNKFLLSLRHSWERGDLILIGKDEGDV